MRLKRIYAANIREGMKRVREELGADAVILSNRKLEDGIEIVAATDYDERAYAGLQRQAVETAEAAAPAAAVPAAPVVAAVESVAAPVAARSGLFAAASRPAPVTAAPPPRKPAPAESRAPSIDAVDTRARPSVAWAQDPVLVQMQREISSLRELLEQQMTSIAWGRAGRQQPQRFELLERLLKLGLDAELAYQLTDAALAQPDGEHAWQAALAQLGAGLLTDDGDILAQGGVVALVGPTGVGKTTTVAKLAARYTLRHGPRKVGLVTTDSYRIGAFDQLRTFAMILDVPVRIASDAAELRQALADFADKELVLIDTAGMSQRDVRLAQQLSMLQTLPAVRTWLVMAANAQGSTLDEAADAFAGANPAGAILTKLDETSCLGGVLGVLYRRGLRLAFIANGQRVPEDLQTARTDELLQTAIDLASARNFSVAEEAMLLTYGRRVANASL